MKNTCKTKKAKENGKLEESAEHGRVHSEDKNNINNKQTKEDNININLYQNYLLYSEVKLIL